MPLLCCSSAFVVVLLLLLCRPLGANGRAAPPGASPPSPGAPAGQPVQQAAPAVNGSAAAAAGLPAAAAPPPLGRMDQSLLLFYGVSVCSCCSAVPGFLILASRCVVCKISFSGYELALLQKKKKPVLIWWASRVLPFGVVG